MAISKNKVDDFLLAARIMIDNAQTDPLIKAELANFGYDDTRFQAIKVLYEETAALQAAQKKEFGEQVAATAEVNDLWEKADEMYINTLKIARVALKETPELGKIVLLYGSRKQSLPGWLEQARIFYTNLIEKPELMALMARFGYTPEKIQREFGVYNKLAEQNARQKIEMGEAQAATTARDRKLDELASNISDLRAVAKVALKNDSQQLEKLGILARAEGSGPRKKQAGGGSRRYGRYGLKNGNPRLGKSRGFIFR
ncbi:MAG TPA: hypothetical protein VHY08_24515 [Bacillota bacterium]|nr:hypothetical protein [Bacillota bacterium]